MPIYGDLYQNLQWSLTFYLKVVAHLKSASEAIYDVINMATIMRNYSLIKAMVYFILFYLFIHCFERVAQLASKLFYLVALYK